MFKGLGALIASGALFHPMVLLGVAFGVYQTLARPFSEIYIQFKDWRLWALALLIALFYEGILRLTIRKSEGFAAAEFAAGAAGNALRIVAGAVFSVLFLMFMGAGEFTAEEEFE